LYARIGADRGAAFPIPGVPTMSAIASHDRFAAGRLDAPAGSAATGLWQQCRAWLARRAARTELERLDDRLLADIGITRSDIPSIVDGSERPL
jgi:uncharacterized protein YjiS (DUF1127 family)